MRQHLVTCSEQFLQQEPSGYAGGAFTVPALTGEAPLAVITADGTAGDHLNGDAHGGSLVKRKGALPPVDIEQGLSNGPSPHSSKGNLDGLDRSATTVAADRMGASRWGASYWTQVRGRGVACSANTLCLANTGRSGSFAAHGCVARSGARPAPGVPRISWLAAPAALQLTPFQSAPAQHPPCRPFLPCPCCDCLKMKQTTSTALPRSSTPCLCVPCGCGALRR